MIDHRDVQVLFADLQDSILPGSRTNEPAAIRRSARALAEVARLLELPVTVSAAPRPGGPGVITEVTDVLDAPAHVRTGPGCFDHPGTRAAIEEARRPVLVICGVMTEIVVLSTALDALREGWQVHVVLDACGGMSSRSEDAALRRIEAAGGHSTSVPSLLGEMVRDFTTPTGAKVISTLHGLFAPAA